MEEIIHHRDTEAQRRDKKVSAIQFLIILSMSSLCLRVSVVKINFLCTQT